MLPLMLHIIHIVLQNMLHLIIKNDNKTLFNKLLFSSI